jgi:tRNA G18 (ribose-2'-O)-methylase SpoU
MGCPVTSNSLIIPIHALDDPRVFHYRNLKERELARLGGRFIAEGEWVVRRLLESSYATESVLVIERKAELIAPHVPGHVPVYVTTPAVMEQILGFDFHSGIMAVGVRGPSPKIDDIIRTAADPRRITLAVCPQIEKTDNMGAVIRVAAAFGATAMILGERCCDPFYRQSVRVSMGAALKIPIVRSSDLFADLRTLKQSHGVELIATVLEADAQPLETAVRGQRIALLFGNEGYGLDQKLIEVCDRRVTIPMHMGTDSLNVAVAAAVFLYHFTRVAAVTP